MTYFIAPGIKNFKDIYPLKYPNEIDLVEKYQEFAGLHTKVILSQSRNENIVYARRIIINAYLHLTRITLVEIGKRLHRTHASIIHLRNQHDHMMKYDFLYNKNFINFLGFIKGQDTKFDKPKYYRDEK
jgi:hypothetical protein